MALPISIGPEDVNRLHFELLNAWIELQKRQKVTLQPGLKTGFSIGLVSGDDAGDIPVILRNLSDGHSRSIRAQCC